ncbi:TPR-like protein [Exidia glandulosa HHB12029]|uniref:TPR-like protein n=1 Tax=Exidia glandulosa HHB12029 TaxID=1314781 RepID=A0A165MMY8_EXIGL|nr:TPR-like protein [Exidia glandulosa HHB12029]
MSFSSASAAVSSSPSQLSHPPPMLSASRSPTGAMVQSSATPASPSPPALISQSPRVAPHHSDSLGPRTMRTMALGAVTTVGLAALTPLMVAGTRVAGEGSFTVTLAVAAVRHAAVSVHEQSRRVKHNKKTALQVGDKAVSLFNALVTAEGNMPLVDVIVNAEHIMRLFGDARDQFHRTETASRIRLTHGKKIAVELQNILDEAETILRQLQVQGSSGPTSSTLVPQVLPANPFPTKATVLDGIELSYHDNVAEIEVVMQLVVDMLDRIRNDTVQHAAASDTLMQFAQHLLSVVEGTLDELQQLEAASGVRQILAVPTVSTFLAGARSKIKDAIQDYQTSVATWTAGAVHRIGKNVERLVSSQPLAASASLITRIPPPLPRVFHGREAEIALAQDQILNHQPARIPILGAGGIGKTSLALAILHDANIKAHFADQCLFLACDSAPDTDAIVNYLLRMLQLEVSGRDPWDALLTALNATTTLLVLDNFETVYTGSHRRKADLLLQGLADCSRLTLILTMRGASLPKSITWSLSRVESSLQPLSPAAEDQDTRSIANATQHLGNIECMLDNYPTARSHLQEARNLFEGIGDRLGQAQCMRSLGNIERMLNNYPTARSCIQDAQKLFEGIGDRLGQAQCLQSLGNIELMLHSYPTAKSHLQEAQNLFEGIGNHFGQAQCMLSLGDIEHILSNYPTARSLLEEAQTLFERIDNHLGQAQCMKSLGEIECMLNNYPAARSLLEEAQTLFEGIGSRLGQAQCMRSLGDIEYMLNNYTTARSCLQGAQNLFEVMGDRLGQAQCMRSLGAIEHKLKNYPTARSLFQEAQILCEEIGDRSGQAYSMLSLGYLEKYLDEYTQALQYFTDARAIYVTIEGQARFVDECDKKIEELHELMQTDQ